MSRARFLLAIGAFAAPFTLIAEARAQSALEALFAPIQRLWSGEQENTLPYEVSINLPDDKKTLKEPLEQASALAAGSSEGANSMANLLAMARQEPDRLTAALYQKGYYSGKIEVRIADQLIDDKTTEFEAAEERPVPVSITVDPGPLFQFGPVEISYRNRKPVPEAASAIPEEVGLVEGKPALSGKILTTGRSLVSYWKERGHAFAEITSQDVTADHAAEKVNVDIVVDAGKPVRYGEVTVKGQERFETELLRSRADIQPGETYSPKGLTAARKRVAKLDGLRAVRIIEGEELDASGRIPITIQVTERKPRYVGANASVSSVDGAEIGAYWGHRNIYGGGETVRIDGNVSNLGEDTARDLEYEARLTATQPSLLSAYTNYKAVFSYEHEKPESYESDEAKASFGVTHEFSEVLQGELALQGSWIHTEEAIGEGEFVLVSLPGELIYDTRDNPLHATKGLRAALAAEPALDVKNETGFVYTRGQISGYAQVGGDQPVILAGKIAAGTIAGADLLEVPATSRFLAGGGGSVRGYEFRSVGPKFGGETIAGLSLVELSGELRIRINETIGVVPFVDAAFVTSDSFFGGESETAVGAGLGLRYHTAIGPIRLDVATPIDRLEDDPEIVFYVGLGQSF